LASLLGWTLDGSQTALVEFGRLDAFAARQTANRPAPRLRLRDCDRADLELVIEGLKALCRKDPVAAAALRESGR
jgi:hypothetical protein